MYDAAEQLVFDCEKAVVVLGKGEDFLLVRLEEKLNMEELRETARLNGYTYVGVIGLTDDGPPKVECEPDPESMRTMIHAGLALAGALAESLHKKQTSTEFCERLFALPDTRPEA